ncbi:N-acetyltransferase [Actinocatenispora thailandica]|uniref:N-acetyltransferase n=1 Tax=Actinocatenispora thailandica TaxID=227318 RepID=A0A7R7DR12_9ACTN|nr:GNAT family N-acetyltransferase [Actinocatenispora thailandica]BCJ36177.1 N-acetyltransferase [Actinocatenispora thailandica]
MTDAAWLPEPLTTDRLRLRAFSGSDVPFLVEMGGDPETWRYLGGVRPLEERRRSIERAFDTPNVFIACAGTAQIGFISLRTCDRESAGGAPEIGYVFARAHWGRGYAREAVAAVLDWGFATFPEAPRIVALTQEANGRSRRLLESLGMRLVERYFAWDAEQTMFAVDRP